MKREGMQRQASEACLLSKEPDGPRCAVAPIAHDGMAGKPGMPPDLMLAAAHKIALDEGIADASAKNPETGLAGESPAKAFRM